MDEKLNALIIGKMDLEAKCKTMEKLLVDTAFDYQSPEKAKTSDDDKQDYIRELIQKRREARRQGNKNEERDINKEIRKNMRKERRIRKAENTTKVLSEFKDLKHLEIFRTEGRRQCINMMKDKEGQECTDKKDIAEVFATFFKELYNGSGTEILYREATDTIENITSEEIKGELKHMASNKAGDENGVIIEIFVHASDNFLGIPADFFINYETRDSSSRILENFLD